MGLSNAERQQRHRDRQKQKLDELQTALAVATRPIIDSEPMALLEGLLDGLLDVVWSIIQRQGNPEGYVDRRDFRRDFLGRRNLLDELAAFKTSATPDGTPDLDLAIECLGTIYATAKACKSFTTL